MKKRDEYMYEDEEPTKEEQREFKHNFIETGLMIVVLLFVLMPWFQDFGYKAKENNVKDRSLCYSYESNPNLVLDITLGSGETYNNVKTVYLQDWDGTHWAGQRPVEGVWAMEDGGVILKKGTCYAVQFPKPVSEDGGE